jgi:hypothetical protein
MRNRLSDHLALMEADNSVLPLVYFLGAKDHPRFPVKIGRSTTRAIDRRLGSLQTSMPYELEFLFIAQADGWVETRVHREFAELRLRGEWFRRTRALNQFIESLQDEVPEWRSLLGLRWKWRDGVVLDEEGNPAMQSVPA